jgi:hypothetical protein
MATVLADLVGTETARAVPAGGKYITMHFYPKAGASCFECGKAPELGTRVAYLPTVDKDGKYEPYYWCSAHLAQGAAALNLGPDLVQPKPAKAKQAKAEPSHDARKRPGKVTTTKADPFPAVSEAEKAIIQARAIADRALEVGRERAAQTPKLVRDIQQAVSVRLVAKVESVLDSPEADSILTKAALGALTKALEGLI